MNGAIIGGTGFYDAGDLLRTESVETPFGTVDVEIIRVEAPLLFGQRASDNGVEVQVHTASINSCFKAVASHDAISLIDEKVHELRQGSHPGLSAFYAAVVHR